MTGRNETLNFESRATLILAGARGRGTRPSRPQALHTRFLRLDKGSKAKRCMMSTDTVKLEELSLQPADSEKGTDGLPTATEPLKQDDATDNTQATSSSGEGTAVQGTTVKGTTSRWITLLIAVATLLGNGFLSAGISIIAPFYPIAVSCIYSWDNISIY